MSAPVESDALLIGAGDLGIRIGRRLAAAGLSVTGVRRRIEELPPEIEGLAVDLTDESSRVPELAARCLVVALTAGGRDPDAYRRVYVDGMRRALDAIDRSGVSPERAVLVSSTSVFGDLDSGRDGWVDEDTPPQPTRATGQVLLEAERLFAERLPGGVMARMSGLYGRGVPRLADQVRRGENPDPGRWTNRVHRDDAAAAVVHLLGLGSTAPGPSAEPPAGGVFVVTDTAPVVADEVRGFIAERLGVPWTSVEAEPHGKRLSSARLLASGWVPQYPTYREGYAALL